MAVHTLISSISCILTESCLYESGLDSLPITAPTKNQAIVGATGVYLIKKNYFKCLTYIQQLKPFEVTKYRWILRVVLYLLVRSLFSAIRPNLRDSTSCC